MKYITSLVSLLFVSQSLIAGDKAGRTMTTAVGHQITFTEPVTATVSVNNAATGAREVKTFDKIQERPMLLNGKEIVCNFPYKLVSSTKRKLELFIDKEIKTAVNQLDTGASYTYSVSDIVVDETGKVVYYVTEGIKDARVRDFSSYAPNIHPIDPTQQQVFNNALVKALSIAKIDPLIIDGKAVPFALHISTRFIK